MDSLNINIREDLILDGGPFYHEFHADELIREPWNAYSSLIFFIPVIYWLIKLRGEYKKNLIIMIILPFLFLNGIGSTLYHAFRVSPYLLYLDFLPASAMSIILSTYLWKRVTNSLLRGILIVVVFYVVGILSVVTLRRFEGLSEMGPNIAYLFVGASYFVPILVILMKTKFKYLHLVLISFSSLGLALLFRFLDYPNDNPFPNFLPQGTHFLWHVCSVVAAFSMGYYVYYLQQISLNRK